MPVPQSKIHLAIAFDENYLKHFYALFASVLFNNQGRSIHVHAIATGISKEERLRIEQFGAIYEAQVSFYEINEELAQSFVLTGKWSKAVYYRLFFPLIVPDDVIRLLYLDTDIIVINDLDELYHADFNGRPVAAVYDNWVKTAPQLGILKEGDYFNSGVMLINVPVWNQQNISEKVFAYLSKYPERIRFVDQCGLNGVLIGNWKKLDSRFNVMRSSIPDEMSQKEKKEFLKGKILIHYTLDRPWKMLCRNPYRTLYFHYLKKAPYQGPKTFEDYSVSKIPGYIRIKLVEKYHELPFAKALWQKLKSTAKG